MTTLDSVEPDPPDIRVWHNSLPILNLEVTEYHVDREQVATNSRWRERLWPKVDVLRRKDCSLRDILGFVVFSDSTLPALNKREDEQLADELVRIAKHVGSMLGDSEELKISFSLRTVVASYPVISPGWIFFPSDEWPLCSQHIAAVTFSRIACGWHRWTCPQVDAGWTQITTEKFRSIFDEKEAKVRKACHDVSRFPLGVPTWLVIVCDLFNDLTTHLYPGSEADREELFQAIQQCNYDFAQSPFAEVWLYAEFAHSKLRIFPTPENSSPSPG